MECRDKDKRMSRISRECENCGKKFYFLKSRLTHSKKKFCSAKCYQESRRKGTAFTCQACGKQFYRSLSKIKAGGGKFCSWKCAKERQGKDHPNYKYGSHTFKKLAETLKDKKCSLCGSEKNVDIHHKDGNKKNNELDNGILLCRQCHMRIHKLKNKFNISHIKALTIFKADKAYLLSPYRFHNYAPPDSSLIGTEDLT